MLDPASEHSIAIMGRKKEDLSFFLAASIEPQPNDDHVIHIFVFASNWNSKGT